MITKRKLFVPQLIPNLIVEALVIGKFLMNILYIISETI